MIMSTAYILLLALPGALGTVPANPQAGKDGVKLADILTKGLWAPVSPLGPIVIETCTLSFRADGHVREEIADDTGLSNSDGTWALERTDDGDVLRLSDELRYHGRFAIKYFEKEKAFDLRIGSGLTERVLRFEKLKTGVTRTVQGRSKGRCAKNLTPLSVQIRSTEMITSGFRVFRVNSGIVFPPSAGHDPRIHTTLHEHALHF